jgi:dTDP-4-amino-4,6-dideoxygalactose transaminase
MGTESIPMLDLKAEFEPLREEILERVAAVFDSGWFYLGQETQGLEAEWAAYCGTEYAVGLGSGTEAVWLALLAAGIGPGDEVITVSHTFIATVAAVHFCGARPVFVDINPATYNMEVGQVEAAITPRTRALLPVHLYGQPAEMAPLMALAERYRLWVIEDACQAHGAEYGGRRAGGLGHIGATSFVFTKNLKAHGDAGAITADNRAIDHKVRALRDHGREGKYEHPHFGLNCRIDEVQAAVVRVKLACLEAWTEARRRNAARLSEGLAGLEWLALPVEAPGRRHVYHQYVVRTPHRDALAEHLRRQGVSTGIHYPIPCHLQGACAHLGYGPGSLPQTERAAREVLSLPVYPELSKSQLDQIVEAVRSFQPPAKGESRMRNLELRMAND